MLSYPSLNPIAFAVGSLSVHWYGLMYGVGFLAASLLGGYRARQAWRGWTVTQVNDCLFYSMLGIILGGRLGYALFYDGPRFLHAPWALFALWEGGMSFHGGLLGVLIALKWHARKMQKPLLDLLDFVAPLVPLGLGAGRIGNFINGELWGRVSHVPWAMIFPHAGSLPRHPSQLYEALLEGPLLFATLWLYSRKPRACGAVSGLFAILYSAFRFCVEFFREPDAQLGFIAFGWLSMGQLLSLPLMGVGLWLLYNSPTKSSQF